MKQLPPIDDLKEELLHYTGIADKLPQGVYQSTRDGVFRYVNDSFARMLGFDSARELLASVNNISEEFYVDKHFRSELMRRIEESGAVRGVEYKLRTKNGNEIWVRVSVCSIRDRSGAVAYYEGIAEDITEKKQIELELEAVTAELRRSNEELERFASVLAHDLQGPASVVDQWISLFLSRCGTSLDEGPREMLKEASIGLGRMRQLIFRLLDYSRLGGGVLRPIDTNQSVARAIEASRSLIEQEQATVLVGQLPSVGGSEVLLEQLFGNLLGNALKFRAPETPLVIRISSRRDRGNWHFEFSDNGTGFAPSEVSRVFDAFHRSQNAQARPGSGMGLAICRRIVERLQGRIWATSQPNVGTTISFALPVLLTSAPGGVATYGASPTSRSGLGSPARSMIR